MLDGSVKKIVFLSVRPGRITERIQIVAVADLLLLVLNPLLESRDNALERKHVELSDARVAALDWSEEMKCRSALELLGNLFGRKTFVGENDTFGNVVVNNERTIGPGVNDVSGEKS